MMQQNSPPNLFIIGAPKSGTTALANNLTQSKKIFLPIKKEPRFFDAETFYDYEEDYPIKDITEYLKIYKNKGDYKYRIDASVFNMYSKKSIDAILKLSPNAKFIIILREPVDASVSMHKQRLKYIDSKMREVSDRFMDCWNLNNERKHGRGYPKKCRNKFLFRYDLLFSYEKYLPYIMSTIPEENLIIVGYHFYKNSPNEFYKKIFDFLGIDMIAIKNNTMNSSGIVKINLYKKFIFKFALFFRTRLKFVRFSKKFKMKTKSVLFSPSSPSSLDSSVDEKVVEFFSQTNEYLKQLNIK